MDKKDLPIRRSIRLPFCDYAGEGAYFVTICTQNRRYLFGKIIDDQMQLNDIGKMVERWYFETQNKFSDIKCLEYVIMPNHIHCIWQNVGADLRVCPQPDKTTGEHIGSPLQVLPWQNNNSI